MGQTENRKPEDFSSEDIVLTETEESLQTKKKKPGRSRGNILLMMVGILMIGYAAFSIGSLYWDYHKSNELYESLNDDFVTVMPKEENTGTEAEDVIVNQDWSETAIWYEMVQVDLAGVKKKNSDVVGWLYQEGGGPISYPIMYSGDNDTYLHTALNGSEATAGSIFMEGKNQPDFNDSHTIIYGHNMRNGSMFGTLKYLSSKEGYMDTHQYFQIFLPDEIRRYQVFAYEVVAADAWVYQVPFGPNQEFSDFISTIYDKSKVDTDVSVTEEDKIITFSTCSGSSNRFVVHAVWVDTYDYETKTTTQSQKLQLTDTQNTDSSQKQSAEIEEPEIEFLAQ